MSAQRNVVQYIKDEEQDYYSDDDLFDISSWGADLSFRELIDRYNTAELIKPELQRKYVWDKTEASRFIDSLLLGLPVPSIFLAKTSDEKMLIVDGYQRIMTVHDYVSGVFAGDGKVFRLTRSEKINRRWRGRAFSELDEVEQRKIRNTTIHAIIFVQQRPQNNNTSLYQVFERINTSGRTLLPQEIRNCIYQGSLNSLLLELNKDPRWRRLYGLGEEDSRMRDAEFILRFFALSSDLFKQQNVEGISLKKFLNQFMSKNQHLDAAGLENLRQRFLAAIQLIHDKFGASAYHNLSPTLHDRLVGKFGPTIFDSITIAADYAICVGNYQLPDSIESARRALLMNEAYKSAISKETMRIDSIKTRIRMAVTNLFGLEYE